MMRSVLANRLLSTHRKYQFGASDFIQSQCLTVYFKQALVATLRVGFAMSRKEPKYEVEGKYPYIVKQ